MLYEPVVYNPKSKVPQERIEKIISNHLYALENLRKLNPEGVGVLFAEALLERYVMRGYAWLPLPQGGYRIFSPFETGFYGRETLIKE
ncbi:hypothetical protein D6774_00470 [Candidatus Woesearchaeota archaeon]|nr:MAG: hypothetical protein D6774_00470 [Candidatus Woesearchaeota archaeon]